MEVPRWPCFSHLGMSACLNILTSKFKIVGKTPIKEQRSSNLTPNMGPCSSGAMNVDGDQLLESHGPEVVYADIATFQPESKPLKTATEDGHHQDWSQSLNSNPKQESKEIVDMNKKCDQRTNEECGWNCWTIKLIFLCLGICVIVGGAWFAYGALKENPEPWAKEAICWVRGVFGQECNIEQGGSVNSSTDSPTTGSTHSPVTGEKPKDTPENPSVTTQTTQSPTTMTATEATTGPTKGKVIFIGG